MCPPTPESVQATTPAVYDVGDLAALLLISERQVWRLSDRGAIPGRIHIGRSARWLRTTIDRWLADGCPRPRRS
jgi:predicted DNA-binding transcriptional regulator AlpA